MVLIIAIDFFDAITTKEGPMEIRNLITFIQVAELNSFTRAAEALGYTQSTVSFQIKQLETELNCLLFERINHTITLTDKGRQLLEYAHGVTTLTDEFLQNMDSQNVLRGKIHLVAPDSVCEEILLNSYPAFHAQHPQIDLKITNADTRTMFTMLDKNEADAVITLDGHNYQQDHVIAKEAPVQMHFVTNPHSPFARQDAIKIEALADMPFILTEKNMGYRRIFDNELARRSIDIHPVLEVGRTDIITTLLEQMALISYLPDFITQKKVQEGRLVHLNVADFDITIWKQLIYHRNKWLSNSMRAFLDFVQTHEF